MGLLAINLIRKLWPYLTGILVAIAIVWTAYDKGYDQAEIKAKAEISQIKEASAESEALAWRQKNDLEAQYRQKATKADNDYTALNGKYQSSLLRYAGAHSARTASSSSYAVPTVKPDGTSPDTDISKIVISLEDAQICAVNTARLQTAHDWALSISPDQSKSVESGQTSSSEKP